MLAVDAADSGLVRKWADKGHLPTFARLLADGLMRRCGPITGRLRGLASGTRRGGSAEGQPASSLPRPGGLGLLLRSVLRITLRGPSILALDGRESPSPRCLHSAHLALGNPGRLRGHRCRSRRAPERPAPRGARPSRGCHPGPLRRTERASLAIGSRGAVGPVRGLVARLVVSLARFRRPRRSAVTDRGSGELERHEARRDGHKDPSGGIEIHDQPPHQAEGSEQPNNGDQSQAEGLHRSKRAPISSISNIRAARVSTPD